MGGPQKFYWGDEAKPDHHNRGYPEAERARGFSNNSRSPSAWLYTGFLIFTQLVSSGVYRPSLRLATMPSKSSSHAVLSTFKLILDRWRMHYAG
jgi:hypothetical protein